VQFHAQGKRDKQRAFAAYFMFYIPEQTRPMPNEKLSDTLDASATQLGVGHTVSEATLIAKQTSLGHSLPGQAVSRLRASTARW
jgi:hypothetical protein